MIIHKQILIRNHRHKVTHDQVIHEEITTKIETQHDQENHIIITRDSINLEITTEEINNF